MSSRRKKLKQAKLREKIMKEENQTTSHHELPKHCSVSGNVTVSGALQVLESEKADKQHKAERKEDGVYRDHTRGFEDSSLRISRLALVGTIIYFIATVAILVYTKKSADAAAASAVAAGDAARSTKEALIATNRSWIEVTMAPPWDTFKKPEILDHLKMIQVPLQFTNIGNEPAKQVLISGAIEVLGETEMPKFNDLVNPFSVPIIYPHRHDIFVAIKRAPENNPLPVPEPMSPTLKNELEAGSKYLVIYANGIFSDQFGNHWFKYCAWIDFAKTMRTYPSKDCSDYNSTGDGQFPGIK
jgi:hypothetical protein